MEEEMVEETEEEVEMEEEMEEETEEEVEIRKPSGNLESENCNFTMF